MLESAWRVEVSTEVWGSRATERPQGESGKDFVSPAGKDIRCYYYFILLKPYNKHAQSCTIKLKKSSLHAAEKN